MLFAHDSILGEEEESTYLEIAPEDPPAVYVSLQEHASAAAHLLATSGACCSSRRSHSRTS